MKRKTSGLPSRIWSLGCLPPTDGIDGFFDQLHRARDYYNARVAIEGERRARRAQLPSTADLVNRVAELRAQESDLVTELRSLKSRVSRKQASVVSRSAAVREQLKTLRLNIKTARADLKEARRERRNRFEAADAELARRVVEVAGPSAGPRTVERANAEALRTMLTEADWPDEWKSERRIDADALAKVKRARAESGLAPGTYLLTDKACAAAFSKSRRDVPRERRGIEGRVGVQLRRDSVASILGGDCSSLKIRLLPDRRGRAEGPRYGVVSMRVSRDDADPVVWTKFPGKVHRLPPADAVATQAWILVRRVGPKLRFDLQLTIESAEFSAPKNTGRGVVAVNTCWATTGDGIRVARWVDDTGHVGELVLPQRLVERLRYCDEIAGAKSLHFDAAKAALVAWMRSHPESVTEEMATATENIGSWRAAWRLERAAGKVPADSDRVHELWQRWHAERLGDPGGKRDLFDTWDAVSAWAAGNGAADPCTQMAFYLYLWARKDRHLWTWAEHQRRRTQLQRRDVYRSVAKNLARTYDTVLLDDIKLTSFARKAGPETEEENFTRRTRSIACPSAWRALLKESARVDLVLAENITREHADCGHVNAPVADKTSEILSCANCGQSYQRDDNACRVMLKRYFERFGGDATPGGAREGFCDAAE